MGIAAPCACQLMSDKLQLYYYIVEAVLLAVKEMNDILGKFALISISSRSSGREYNALIHFFGHSSPLHKNEQFNHLSTSLD